MSHIFDNIPFVGDYWEVKVKGGTIVSVVYISHINHYIVGFKEHWTNMKVRQHKLENIEFIRRIT